MDACEPQMEYNRKRDEGEEIVYLNPKTKKIGKCKDDAYNRHKQCQRGIRSQW